MSWWDPRTWGDLKEKKPQVGIPTPPSVGEKAPSEIIKEEVKKSPPVSKYKLGEKITPTPSRGRSRGIPTPPSVGEKAPSEIIKEEVKKSPPVSKYKLGEKIQPAPAKIIQPSISAYDPNKKVTPYGQTYVQAIAGGFGVMGRNIKQFFTGRTHEYKDPLAGFEHAGVLKRDLPTMTPYFGTSTFGQGAFQTYGELQKEIDVGRGIEIIKIRGSTEQQMRDIQKEYQSKINIGALTVEEATSQYASAVLPIQEQFSLDVEKIYGKRPDIPGLYERSGVAVQKFAPVVLDIGGYTIAGAVGGGLGIAGYGVFRGSQLAAKGQYKDIHAGTELYAGIAELSPESKAAGMHFGMAAYGGYTAVYQTGASITALRIKEGMEAKGVSMPRIISREGDDVFRVMTRTGRRTPTFEADTKTTFDVFRVGDGRFQIGSGTGKTTTRVLDWMKQGTGEYPWRTATKSFTIMGRGGEAMMINAPEDVRAFVGRGVIGIDEGIRGVRFGGVSRPVGERAWVGVGGEVRGVRLYGTGRTTALVSPKDLVFGKDISFVDTGGKVWGWKGGGAKSSKQFFEQLYKPDAVLDISGQATTTAQKITSGVSVSTPRISFIPSVAMGVSGTRLISRQRGVTIQTPSLSLLQEPAMRDRQRFFQPQTGRSMMEQMGRVRQEFGVLPRLLQELGTKQIQRQKLGVSQFVPTISIPGFRISPTITPPPLIPIIPWLPSGRLGTALGTRRIPAKQLFGYTPSYAGYTWKIKAPQIPKAPFGKFTGLEIRPIVPGGIKLKI